MTTISPFAELLGQAAYHFAIIKPLLPTYGHLIISALFPIYIAAHASLSRPSSAAKQPKNSGNDGDLSEDEEEDDGAGPWQKMEGLAPSDALMFPLMAGLTLGSLYLVIKWLEDLAILNKILNIYFSQMGMFFAMAFLKDGLLISRAFVFPRRYRHRGKIWKVDQSERRFVVLDPKSSDLSNAQVRRSPLPAYLGTIHLPDWMMKSLWSFRELLYQKATLRARVHRLFSIKVFFGLLDIMAGVLALFVVVCFTFVAKPWWLTNLFGFSFCYGVLQVLSPSTFWTGSLILGSLFFYDIYFVFFTPLMVTVATKLDVPIKLLFPRPPSPDEDPNISPLTMLGLGDIVIPGMMVGLALRYDLFLYYRRKAIQIAQAAGQKGDKVKPFYQSATGGWDERLWAPPAPSQDPELEPPYHDARSFPKTYFYSSLVGYAIGMIATLLVMQYSKHAQPALLYLVPGVLISLWGTAFAKGEFRSMWNFSDSVEDDAERNEQEQKDGSKSTPNSIERSLFSRLWSGDIKAFADILQENKRPSGSADGKNNERIAFSSALVKGGPVTGETNDKPTDDDKEEKELVSISISVPQKLTEQKWLEGKDK